MELKRLEKLGRLAEETSDERADLAKVRGRLEGRVRARRRLPVLAVLAPIAAAAALILAFFVMRRPMTMTVNGAPATAGAFVAASAAALPIRFDDGTEIAVLPNAHARVVAVSHAGARLVLERGGVDARVVHRSGADWHVAAGPFDVHVIGTSFAASWDPSQQVFRLDLREGAVVVSGGLLDRGSRVSAGETLRIDVRAGRMDLVKTSSLAVATTAEPAPSATVEPPIEIAPTVVGSASPPPSSASSVPARTWQPLASSGKYNAALELAKQVGFTHECEHASAPDVLLLGDVARLAGDVPRALEAYRAVRRRFPKSSHASSAAFALGRTAFERQHAYAEAATWFETAVREGGPFARDAAGRLIEAKKAAGDLAGAKAAAKSYLDRWPTGPHATLARSLNSE